MTFIPRILASASNTHMHYSFLLDGNAHLCAVFVVLSQTRDVFRAVFCVSATACNVKYKILWS